ncbi:MAG: pyridoxal phosphate-dependent aminotransferase [Odoribacteraceae bacterium]|jgi:cystathionine beta-lyase|nr:pyridoxal phosphate-dependent aminotransferase [Odoribacteraceae bacterium]
MQERYDFDKIVDRRGTNALKVDALEERYGDANLIPLWVADMDFETPPFIVDALRQRLQHPVFGYTKDPAGYLPSIINWLRQRHDWEVRPEWLSYIPGIVKGIGMVVNIFTRPGDKVIIQPPVYHPFRLVPRGNGREVVFNPLKLVGDRYEMDFDHLERLIDDHCKLLVLSNPHNPAGRVWERETLATLAELCERRGVLVVSDEIHSDMMLYGHRHVPFMTASPAAARVSITFGAPSKSFNIAGLVSSYAIVPDDSLRRRFYSWLAANEMNEPTIFAPIATEAAYTLGAEWLRQMLEYVEGNINFMKNYLDARVPAIRVMKPQASFLVWLDCRQLNMEHDTLVNFFIKDAHLALNDGEMFGPGGEGFMRLNVGCSRLLLSRALSQIEAAASRR